MGNKTGWEVDGTMGGGGSREVVRGRGRGREGIVS